MTAESPRRTSHPFFMHDAILAQPEAIAQVLEREGANVQALATALESTERIHIVGIGTSWHAAVVGEYLLRVVGGHDSARAWNSFEFGGYPPLLTSSDAVIVLSHRGTKLYSAQALKMAREAGARTAIVTGLESAASAELADHVLRTSPQERSAAFTVSHTAAMTILAMLAVELGTMAGNPAAGGLLDSLGRLPGLVEEALATEPVVREWVTWVEGAERLYFAGWGANAATAYEVALKIKETSYLATEGFQLEQYLHGPFVATSPGCAVTFIAPPGWGQERTGTLVEAAKTVGARTFAIVQSGDAEISDLVSTAVFAPATPEPLTPIVYLVPLQLFTYWLAIEKEHDPDVFRLDDPAHKAARAKYEL